MKSKEILTGFITFRGNEYVFIFDDFILNLVPCKNNPKYTNKYEYKEIEKVNYTFANPIKVEEHFLIATTSVGNVVVFFPIASILSVNGNALSIDVDKYIIFNNKEKKINVITFSSYEINHIFVSNKLSSDGFKDDKLSVEVQHYVSDTERFYINNKKVSVYFGYSNRVSFKVGENPLDLKTTFECTFESTNDYEFISKLVDKVAIFIKYLCNRKNIIFDSINLLTPYNEETSIGTGKLYIRNKYVEERSSKRSRCIHYESIKGSVGSILQDISNDALYTRHIPDSYEMGKHITPASFVMITACFEWTFKQLYPDGIVKNNKTLDAEKIVVERLNSILEEPGTTGKVKDIYKYLKKNARYSSLASEIRQVFKDYSDIIKPFASQLESLNDGYSSKSIGDRLTKERNNFAHGNLEKDFNEDAILDIVLLNRIVFIMQLKKYNIDDLLVKKAINDLFGLGIMFK